MTKNSNKIDGTLNGVSWASMSKEAAFKSGMSGSKSEYDLAVVGGGYCGLSIAWHAAASGLSVVLLEAGTIGCGASGRNGGYVVPHLPGGLTADDFRDVLGERKAARLSKIVEHGASYVFDVIRENQIQCDAEQTGWIQPAHSEKSLVKVRKVFNSWQKRGANVQWFDRHEVQARIGAAGYLGGWYGSTGGTVNPYALAQGLARVAQQHGVDIRQNTEVTALGTDGPAKLVITSNAAFKARKVVFATNGYTHGLYPALDQSVIPIRLFHVLTRQLTEDERRTTMPQRIPFTDLRKSGGFGRLTADNRVVSGGAVFTPSNIRSYGLGHVRQRVAEIFPQLAGIEIEHYWEGFCALTETSLPALQRIDENVFSVIGFSTRGVALAQTLGRDVGKFFAETLTEEELPVRVGPVEQIFMQSTKTFLGGLAFPVYQARDRLGLT